jgi:hypothetical protein
VEEDWQMTNLPAIFRPETGELKLPAKPPWVLGIDLGTTNSAVAEIAWNPDEGVVAAARCLTVQQETMEG